MAGSPTVQRRQTNRIKRQLKSLEYEYVLKPKVADDFIRTLYRLSILNDADNYEFYKQNRALEHRHKVLVNKLLCIKGNFIFRRGRKYATWIQKPEPEALKEEIRRLNRFEAKIRHYGINSKEEI
jgi:hypothetical protein